MTTGAKIAIGCGIVAVMLGAGVLVAVFGAAWWVKGKAEEITGEQQRITRLQEKANRNTFTSPADGLIAEPRLLKFLDVRRRVFAVYERHQDEIEERGSKKQADLGDARALFNLVNEIRLAQAQAQADVGMSEAEYRFLVEQVYKSAWASEWGTETSGKSVSESPSEAVDQTRSAGKQLPPEARQAVEQMQEALGAQLGAAQRIDVPKANIDLFRKHEAEIKKYAMTGLEWLGL